MSGTIAWDYAHRPTWSIDLDKCLAIQDVNPEYIYFGHLVTFAELTLGVSFVELEAPWSMESLAEVDAIVVAAPASEDVEVGFGPDRNFEPEEVRAAVQFVESGGGLLVIAEYSHDYWGRNVNDLLASFGITVNNDQLAVRARDGSAVVSRHFSCTRLAQHPISYNVQLFTYQRGASLNCRSPAIPIGRAPGGEAVLAAAAYGRGHVVVIGDSDLLSIPYLGHGNNLALFLNSLASCASAEIPSPSVIAIADSQLRSLVFDLPRVAASIPFSSLPAEDIVSILPGELDQPPNDVGIDPYVPSSVEDFLEQACLWAQKSLPELVRAALLSMRRRSTKSGALRSAASLWMR